MGSPKRRFAALLVVFGLLFAYLTFKIADLQVISPERYVAQADDQSVRSQAIAAQRGRILDRNGAELALSLPQRTLFTDPRFVTDPVATARALAPIVGVDEATLESRLVADNSFGYLSRLMPDDVADRVAELLADPDAPMEGVYVLEEPKRFLPGGSMARGILGTTDVDNVGVGGLELMFDDVLTGTPGRLELEQGPGGRTIATGHHALTPATPGGDVRLTIDQAIQFEAERVLADQVEEMDAAGGMAVLAVPSTGEVLAMASVLRDGGEGEAYVSGNNAALTTVYEPGSVMKVVTMAGVLEEGLVTPESRIDVPDALQVSNHLFTEYKPHGLGSWPLGEIISNSSNTGTIKLAQMLGEEGLHRWFRDFGLGERTAIGFPNEAAGVVLDLEDWSGTSIGSMPIGQGISVTPVQMLSVYNTIANGGVHVPLHLIDGTTDGAGVVHRRTLEEPRRVISPTTAAAVTTMLAATVADGTGVQAQVPGYPAGGKTGTAIKPYNGGYTGPDGIRHYMGTFVGFVPTTDPALSMIVIIDDPRAGAYTGGAVSAPVFSELAQFALRRLAVPAVAAPATAPDGAAEPVVASASGAKVRATPAGIEPEADADSAAAAVH